MLNARQRPQARLVAGPAWDRIARCTPHDGTRCGRRSDPAPECHTSAGVASTAEYHYVVHLSEHGARGATGARGGALGEAPTSSPVGPDRPKGAASARRALAAGLERVALGPRCADDQQLLIPQ